MTMVKKFFDSKWISLVNLSIFSILLAKNYPVLPSDLNFEFSISCLGLFLSMMRFVSQVFSELE